MTEVEFTAGPAAICTVLGGAKDTIGRDGSRSVTIVVGGTPGTCVIQAFGGDTVVGLLAEFVDDVGPPSPGVMPGDGVVVTPGDGVIVGTLPASGFGLVTFGGTVDELKAALAMACASGAPIFSTDASGNFVAYFPTAAATAVNVAFNALWPDGLPTGTPLIGGNCSG